MKLFMRALTIILILIPELVFAKNISVCGGSEGKSYIANIGVLASFNESETGWHDDRISEGKTTVTKIGNEFNILYLDASGTLTSAKDYDAQIIPLPLMTDKDSFSFMAVWPRGPTVEIYSFWKDNNEQNKFSLNQVKGGLIRKQSLLVGNCSYLDFSWIEQQ